MGGIVLATLWTGGKIYTMAQVGETVDAVLVEDGKIVATGSAESLSPLAASIQHLEGNIMYPGFVDSHLHIIGYGEKLKHLDVSAVTSKEALLVKLQERMAEASAHEWVIAIGLNENQFEEPIFPTLAELDALGDAHLIIKRSCHHLILANSKALAFAGITNRTPSPEGGVIDKVDGQLTGILKDAALYLIVNQMPHITPAYIEDALTKAVTSLQSYGLVGGHSEDLSYYGPPSQPIQAYRKIVEAQQSFKVHLLQHHTVFEEVAKMNLASSPFLAFGAMKIFIDGAFGGRTAALRQPYCDDPDNAGMLIHTTEQLASYVQLARQYGQTVAVHAIGDLAIDTILDVFAAYPPQEGQLDRVIHCSLVDEELLAKLAALPVAVDMQPQFVQGEYQAELSRLGEERAQGLHPLKSLLDRGLIVAGGSDAPIEVPNPLHGIYAAVTRRNFGESHDGYNPHEKISRFEAVRLYTVGAAEIIGQQLMRGKIAEGFAADFTILQEDVFTVEMEQLPHIQVACTVVNGQIVYENR
ncbi:regulatory protein AepA [Lysinibacillus boronitolerans JCM 21713 = 10a = NBRC 103108]|uniref:Regulatory protein AepA n=1 Tax=Lysinibacillus boronitolerans JCM 21713 = 10a = NBRC 103108 TaxID=1294264 RepID=A0ABR4XVK9_9BACI|nr:regulatory protein AepA [Lysinibacillus boronitolerans JCM 21713 = 10a = NBRC 103108]